MQAGESEYSIIGTGRQSCSMSTGAEGGFDDMIAATASTSF